MLKKFISLLVLAMYLHGMSGYTMSFHKCTITGFENVYAAYGTVDPCKEMGNDCKETAPHFERGNCCDMQYTVVNIEDDSNITYFKTCFFTSGAGQQLVQSYLLSTNNNPRYFYSDSYTIRPPEPSQICVFRI